MSQVYLNGQFLDDSDAVVSVLDRGFIFGDGIYEVIPVYHGSLFRMEQHLERLENNLAAVQIENPYSRSEWTKLANQLILKNEGVQAAGLYLQLTRGVARRDHAFPDNTTPTVFMMLQAVDSASLQRLRKGIRAITHRDIRWECCHLKTTSLLPNVLLKQWAIQDGADEVILFRDGHITEGSASNVFAVIDGTLMTPPKSERLLPGITRDLILELAREHDIPCQETDIQTEQLISAEEIWISSSTRELVPIIELDGSPVGKGMPGKLWERMFSLYQQFKSDFKG
ncbi:MAG: D-amino acid aminotransferase [Gammaproteobacteria bacterium]|nr:MAG: D-amino acid aminotransferase [Gammaproteobacteria bacterium]